MELRSFVLYGLLWLTVQAGRAHQDPAGDVHPHVVIEEDAFVVYNRYRVYLPKEEEGWYRRSYSVTGEMLEPRHRLTKERGGQLEESWSVERRLGARVGSRDGAEQGDGPFLLFEAAGGQGKARPLPVSGPRGTQVKDSLIVGKTVGFLWGGLRLIDENADDRLWLSIAPIEGFAPGRTVGIGKPCAIWGFPVVSNLVWAGGRWWVAWVRDDTPAEGAEKSDAKRTYHTILSSVESGSGKATHVVLPGISHWNAHLSLATHGGWLCAAWHTSIDGTYPGIAKVVTAFHKVPR